jgi:hypothetical protein
MSSARQLGHLQRQRAPSSALCATLPMLTGSVRTGYADGAYAGGLHALRVRTPGQHAPAKRHWSENTRALMC